LDVWPGWRPATEWPSPPMGLAGFGKPARPCSRRNAEPQGPPRVPFDKGPRRAFRHGRGRRRVRSGAGRSRPAGAAPRFTPRCPRWPATGAFQPDAFNMVIPSPDPPACHRRHAPGAGRTPVLRRVEVRLRQHAHATSTPVGDKSPEGARAAHTVFGDGRSPHSHQLDQEHDRAPPHRPPPAIEALGLASPPCATGAVPANDQSRRALTRSCKPLPTSPTTAPPKKARAGRGPPTRLGLGAAIRVWCCARGWR